MKEKEESNTNQEQQIFFKLVKILATSMNFKEKDISETSLLREGLGIDSFDIWEVVSKIEEAFDIEIQDREIPTINTVADAVKIIKAKLNVLKG